VESVFISFRVYRNRLDAKLVAGSNDSESDLSSVCDENFLK
jgi:hypothetical protein